jgi:nucleotide-binding universal stress UspA family protein
MIARIVLGESITSGRSLMTFNAHFAIRNILVTTDFSEASTRAFGYALALAHRHDATVYVAHVIVPQGRNRQSRSGLCDNMSERDVTQHNLEAWAGSCCAEGAHYRVVLCEGVLGECVSSLIDERKVDLLVLGTKGATGMHTVLLGSQAEEIFRETRCPVLTIGPRYRNDVQCKFRQILFMTDVSDASMRAYSHAVNFAADNGSHLTVLHVVLSSDMRGGYDPAISDRLRSLLWAYEQPDSSDVIVTCGDPLRVIMSQAHHLTADLIVTGIDHAARFVTHVPWTLAHQVVNDAPCPVLTIRS